jgi:hypothetical protein
VGNTSRRRVRHPDAKGNMGSGSSPKKQTAKRQFIISQEAKKRLCLATMRMVWRGIYERKDFLLGCAALNLERGP